MKKISIYTDGACSGNPGKGGWGAILIYPSISGNKEKQISGFNPETTNNQMELQAVIEALKSLKEPCEIDLYTDSKYVMQGITEWIFSWKKNNWRNSSKKPVKNKDFWVELDYLAQKHKINWHWVKAHDGNKYNEIADRLAVEAYS